MLVIIGLLIGGILVAQSIISTSKITAQIAQIQQFDAGVTSFKAAYNNLPGDAPGFGGDGDGAIEQGANRNHIFADEISNFWGSLNSTNFTSVPMGIPGARAIAEGSGRNVPSSKIGKKGSFVVVSGLGTATVIDANSPRNQYVILDPSNAQSILSNWYRFSPSSLSVSAAQPAELKSLDSKLDDGSANSGSILSGSMDSVAPAGAGAGLNPLSACSIGANYQLQNSSFVCTPLIRVGSQAGDPQ